LEVQLMKMNLNELEIRVLASLMEKELTTPESYPLSLNALLSACNQKSNREPVLSLTEEEVLAGLQALGTRGLARLTTTGGRVAKYCHSVTDKLGLSRPCRALLAELMLRGPQTVGELRNRGERMAEFPDLACVEATLGELQQYGPPLVARLPRQAGHKEPRFVQMLAGLPELPPEEESPAAEKGTVEREPRRAAPGDERLVRLEADMGTLRDEVALLRREIEELTKLFS